MKGNCDNASKKDCVSDHESLFHSKDVLCDIASKQLIMGINKSENNSKASWHSTHLVRHISFNFSSFLPAECLVSKFLMEPVT